MNVASKDGVATALTLRSRGDVGSQHADMLECAREGRERLRALEPDDLTVEFYPRG